MNVCDLAVDELADVGVTTLINLKTVVLGANKESGRVYVARVQNLVKASTAVCNSELASVMTDGPRTDMMCE